MPSHLTRQVFRCIIANEPIVHRGCLRRQAYSSTGAQRSHGTQSMRNGLAVRHTSFPVIRRYQQRRSFFGMGLFRSTPTRDAKDANYDPGIEKMMEYAKMERMKARLPPVEDVAEAFKGFIRSRSKNGDSRSIQDSQAQLLLQSLRYILKEQAKLQKTDKLPSLLLDAGELVAAATVVRREPTQSTPAHIDLAHAIYRELSAPELSVNYARRGLDTYISALASGGQAKAARELILQEEHEILAEKQVAFKDGNMAPEGTPSGRSTHRWVRVLKGFTREDDEAEMFRTMNMMKDRGLDRTSLAAQLILGLYLARQDVDSIAQWWEVLRPMVADPRECAESSPQIVVYPLLTWCLETGNLQLGHEVVRDVMKTNPEKMVWDAVLVWAAGTKKSVDEIARMMDVMEKSNESISKKSQWRLPDSETINALVTYAISQNDPYMAERFITLGQDRQIQPDAKTYVLQMDYRLSVGDIDGALVAYKHLQAADLSSNSDVPAVNRLLVALCTSQRHDFDTIMNVAADLSDRSAHFEPLTVSTLSILHLGRDELHDVIDLLNTHAYGYSSTERAAICQVLISYCSEAATTTTRAWDAYTMLRSVFDEMSREQRTELMLNFFARDRPDMAVHVFQHMRQHSRPDTMPTTSTYVDAFLGCAKLADLESLEVVHNQLKLDYNIDTTTYVRNALMIGYTTCGMPRRALDFWDEVVASKEGPSYNSIHCALRACEKSPFGDLKAQEIWARLRRKNVDLTQEMWASHVAALAGNGDNELAVSTLEQAIEQGEVEMDVLVLGSLYSAASGQLKQKDIEIWARERWNEVWERVEEVGWVEDENEMRAVKIDRSVSP